MKVKYEAQKGSRVKHGFIGFTPNNMYWSYNKSLKRWEFNPEDEQYRYSSHQNCKSVNAFIRKLKKAPKGVPFILASKWHGHNVTGFGKLDF